MLLPTVFRCNFTSDFIHPTSFNHIPFAKVRNNPHNPCGYADFYTNLDKMAGASPFCHKSSATIPNSLINSEMMAENFCLVSCNLCYVALEHYCFWERPKLLCFRT